jgi:hypothetical protein
MKACSANTWLKRANLWREPTKPRNGSERPRSIRLCAMQRGKGRILLSTRSANLPPAPPPTLRAGAFFPSVALTNKSLAQINKSSDEGQSD